ncbi:hypothetical protein D9M69_472820 [compost metagenome]
MGDFAVFVVYPGAAVGGGANVVGVPAVGDPFVDVAVHVVDPEGVGRVAAHRRAVAVAVLGAVGVGVLADLVVPLFVEGEREGPRGARAGGVFAFRLADHAVALASLLRQPLGVGLDFVVVDADRRLAGALWIAGLARFAPAPGAFVAALDDYAGLLDVGVQLFRGDVEAADRKRPGEGHLVLWTFVRLLAQLIVRGTHDEAVGGQYHHFRAFRAVLEDGAGIWRFHGFCSLGERQAGKQAKHRCFHREPRWPDSEIFQPGDIPPVLFQSGEPAGGIEQCDGQSCAT